jgi:hypothetical protein
VLNKDGQSARMKNLVEAGLAVVTVALVEPESWDYRLSLWLRHASVLG